MCREITKDFRRDLELTTMVQITLNKQGILLIIVTVPISSAPLKGMCEQKHFQTGLTEFSFLHPQMSNTTSENLELKQ